MKIKWIRYNRKKVFLGLFLILGLIGLGIGFAFISTKLSIDGIVRLKRDSNWSVHFDNFAATTGSVAPVSEPVITDTNVTFSAKLNEPSEFYGFTIDVVNDGNINAILDSLSVTPDFSTIPYGEAVIEYEDGTPIAQGDLLPVGKTKKIKVSMSYKEDAESFPTENQVYNVNVSLAYVQYTGEINYTVTLNPNGSGASVSPTSLQRPQGSYAVDLPTPTRSGYTFDGWFSEATGGEKITDTTVIDDDITYFAHWHNENAVAKIGDTYYNKVDSAFSAVTTNAETTIELIKNATGTSAITIGNGKNIIFDLKGYTYNITSETNMFVNNGTFVLKNGTLSSDSTTSTKGAMDTQKNANTTIDNVHVIVKGKRQPLYNKGGTTTIQGGSILETTANTERPSINNLNDGSYQGRLIILSATIISNNYPAVKSEGGSVVIGREKTPISITDPELRGTYAIEVTAGTVDFYGGILKGTNSSVVSGTVTYHGTKKTGTDGSYNTIYVE